MSTAHGDMVSVVVPAFNEGSGLEATLDRIGGALGERVQVVVVSDGSTDDTFAVAADWASRHGGVAVELATNVGSHAAIRCGLEHATGAAVAVIAADGQDPPEALPAMLAEVASGTDIVWGRRVARRRDPLPRRAASALYYRVFRLLTGLDYPPSGIDFVVMSRFAADTIRRFGERNLPLFLALFNLGLPTSTIDYERGERTTGRSGWTLRKRLRLAMDMVTSYSPAPIRLVSAVGLLVGSVGLLFGAITVVRAMTGGVPVEGWASLMVVSSLMLGILLVAVGFIGEYLWRTLDEARRRPLYIERSIVGED